MDTLLQDLRFAIRTLVRTPLVTAIAVLSLAVGIGANTTIFSAVNALFLRGLPVAEPERLVALFTVEAKQGQNAFLGNFMPVSRPNYESLRDGADAVFSDLVDVLFVGGAMRVGAGEAEPTGGQLVSGNYFAALGVEPAHGRVFGPEEDAVPGAHPVLVLSDDLWRERFSADPGVVGREVLLNEQAFTIVGVMRPEFTGTFTLGNTGFWAPTAMHDTFLTGTVGEWYDSRRALLTFVYGRLAPGVAIGEAQARVDAIGGTLAEAYPQDNGGRGFHLLPFAEATIPPGLREVFVMGGGLMMGVVAAVLLIACVNVANLLLGRANARRREMAIRMAQGADRRRLLRQLLTESLLLAGLAGGLGLALSVWGRQLLWAMRPPFLQNAAVPLALDPRVLLFTVGISLVTGLLFGLAPALRASRPRIVEDLKEAGLAERGMVRTWSVKNLLVVAQVSLSFVALIFAGLFLRSLASATRIDLGFRPEGLVTMTFDVGQRGYDEARGLRFYDEVTERIAAVPGVDAATVASAPPLVGGGFSRTVFVAGRDREAENNGILTAVSSVGPGYFPTIGTPLLRGRAPEPADRAGGRLVATINRAAAERFWPGEDALGKRFLFHGDEEERLVVGIVADAKVGTIGEDPQPQFFLPVTQEYSPAMTLLARVAGPPEAMLETLRREVQLVDPALAVGNVQTMADAVEVALWAPRTTARLLGVMGGLALALAAIGIYGVMSYTVARRRREIAVRMALGASRGQVARLVLGQGLALLAGGLAIGLAVAVLLGRRLEGLLYGVRATDATTLVATAAVLALVAVLANVFPARRATAVDPVRVLRAER